MTYAPQALLNLRAYLKPHTGLSDVELGIVGDENHDGGYHHGWGDRDSDGSDYSWDESSRDSSHKTNAARALDIGMFDRLRELSTWLVAECASGAPDTADIREVIYSPDGKTVKRWDRLGIRSSGDSSHLTHTHISWFADAEQRAKTAVFQRFFEGDDMSWDEIKSYPERGIENPYGYKMGEIQLGTNQGVYDLHAKMEKLTATVQALVDTIAAGGGVLTPAAVRAVVDEELDEAFAGGADNDEAPKG